MANIDKTSSEYIELRDRILQYHGLAIPEIDFGGRYVVVDTVELPAITQNQTTEFFKNSDLYQNATGGEVLNALKMFNYNKAGEMGFEASNTLFGTIAGHGFTQEIENDQITAINILTDVDDAVKFAIDEFSSEQLKSEELIKLIAEKAVKKRPPSDVIFILLHELKHQWIQQHKQGKLKINNSPWTSSDMRHMDLGFNFRGNEDTQEMLCNIFALETVTKLGLPITEFISEITEPLRERKIRKESDKNMRREIDLENQDIDEIERS
ncbi:MAG: hypothetical protein FWE16_00720 [Firmicutes bacterium]|nr:hypothetical protein [Bacillota bacterium]